MSFLILESLPLDPIIKVWLTKVPRPSSGYLNPLNRMIRGMRSDGNLTELDYFLITATELQSQARVPIIFNTNITEVATPTWTALRGYTGNGTNMYLRTNFIPSTNAVKYTLNSASLGLYSRTEGANSGNDMGVVDGTTQMVIASYFTDNKQYGNVNCALFDSFVGTNGLGMKSSQRTGASASNIRANGVVLTTGSNSSVSLPAREVYILARNLNGAPASYSSRQIPMVFIGSGNINHLTFYNRIQTFATEIGFNV